MSDHGFDIIVVRPVVHGHTSMCRGNLLPGTNVPVPPTVRQAYHALHHFIGDVNGDGVTAQYAACEKNGELYVENEGQ